MAGRKNAAKTDAAIASESAPEAAPVSDRAMLSDKELAKAVLAGGFRPRVGEVRRLAEAVLKKVAKKGKGKRKAKNDKLARIPQKKKA